MTKNLPKQLTRDEVADRIGAHLMRMERDPKYNKVDPKHKTRRLWGAGAGRHGAKIGVTYVSYQGRSMLTFEEALSYLLGLDSGFRGEHFEWLRQHPLPKQELEVRYRAIVRTRFGYSLINVTKITGTRVYGERVPADELAKAIGSEFEFRAAFVGSYTEKRDIVKRNATFADFKKLLQLEQERGRAHDRVNQEYNDKVNRLLGKQDEPADGEEEE